MQKETLSDHKNTIYIPLKNYKPSSHPNSGGSLDIDDEFHIIGADFIGRTRQVGHFLSTLVNTKTNRGSYLIAGYRGVGKTSFVQHVLAKYKYSLRGAHRKKEGNKKPFPTLNKYLIKIKSLLLPHPKLIQVSINLGNDEQLEPREVLSDVVRIFEKTLENELEYRDKALRKLLISLPILFVFIQSIYPLNDFLKCLSCSIDKLLINYLVYVCALISWVFYNYKSSTATLYDSIKQLNEDIRSSSSINIGLVHSILNVAKKRNYLPISAREIEMRLIKIIDRASLNKCFFSKIQQNNIIFIFDELDKIGTRITSSENKKKSSQDPLHDIYLRKVKVDFLLGSLKNLVTSSQARFIFISGRELYDACNDERSSTSPLYESIFTDMIYIPSFLTDDSDGKSNRLASMTQSYVMNLLLGTKESRDLSDLADYYKKNQDAHCLIKAELEINNMQLLLRNFVNYLTFRCWGNAKRLHNIFSSYVIRKDNISDESMKQSPLQHVIRNHDEEYYLRFDSAAQQRILMASNIYILLHHQLSRRLSTSDDKLAVSVFFVTNHILKFHGTGFSRADMDRVSASLDVHSSPELNQLVSVILNRVLSPYIRLTRNSLHRYRFLSHYEREIHHISQISNVESAAYNFTLEAEYSVKKYYLRILKNMILSNKESASFTFDRLALADTNMILAKLHYWEHSYDEAQRYFGAADSLLEKLIFEGKHENYQRHPVSLIAYTEAMLFQGLVEEKRDNFTRASALYQSLNSKLTALKDQKSDHPNDTKLDVLGLGYWASHYLHLKRGAKVWRDEHKQLMPLTINDDSKQSLILWDGRKDIRPLYGAEDVNYLRQGTLLIFQNDFRYARAAFKKVIELNKNLFDLRERDAYLGGQANLRLALSYCMGYWKSKHKEMCIADRETEFTSVGNDSEEYQKTIFEGVKKITSGFKDCEKFISYTNIYILDKDKDKDKDKDIILNIDTDDIKGFKLEKSLNLIDAAGHAFEKSGLNSEAAQAYIGGLLLIGLQWEIMPWHDLIGEKKIYYQELKNSTWATIKSFAKKASNNLSITHQQAFGHFLTTFYDRDIGENKPNSKPNIDIIEHLLSAIDNNSASTNKDIFNNDFNWQRSPAGQHLLISILWLEQVRYNAIDEKSPLKNILNQSINRFNLRSQALALWISARDMSVKIKALIRKSQTLNDNELAGLVCTCISSLYQAYAVQRRSTNNHQGLSFPPLALIFYNAWELLATLLEKLYTQKRGKKLSDNIHDLREKLFNLLKDRNMSVSSLFLHYDSMRMRSLEALAAMETLGDTNSQTRRDVLYTKNFLDDDYEDIGFHLDWTFYQCFGVGSLAHCQSIDKRHSYLEEKFND